MLKALKLRSIFAYSGLKSSPNKNLNKSPQIGIVFLEYPNNRSDLFNQTNDFIENSLDAPSD